MHSDKKIVSLPTKEQVEREQKRYRRRRAYNKALGGTIYVLTLVAAIAVLVATLILPVLQIEGKSMEPTLKTALQSEKRRYSPVDQHNKICQG